MHTCHVQWIIVLGTFNVSVSVQGGLKDIHVWYGVPIFLFSFCDSANFVCQCSMSYLCATYWPPPFFMCFLPPPLQTSFTTICTNHNLFFPPISEHTVPTPASMWPRRVTGGVYWCPEWPAIPQYRIVFARSLSCWCKRMDATVALWKGVFCIVETNIAGGHCLCMDVTLNRDIYCSERGCCVVYSEQVGDLNWRCHNQIYENVELTCPLCPPAEDCSSQRMNLFSVFLTSEVLFVQSISLALHSLKILECQIAKHF